MNWRTMLFLLTIAILACAGCGEGDNGGGSGTGGVFAAAGPLTLQAESENEIVFHVSYGDVQLKNVEIHGRNFVAATIDGFDSWGDTGQPSLPALRRAVLLPFGAKAAVTVDPKMVERIRVAGPIAPTQPSVPKLPGALDRAPFAMDESLYAADAFVVGRFADIVDEEMVRNHRLALLEITPVDYNPAKNELLVARDLTVTIHLSDADLAQTTALAERFGNPIFDEIVIAYIANTGAHWAIFDAPKKGADYLIIYADDLAGTALDELAALKTRDGWTVHTEDVEAIGATVAEISAYIKLQYNLLPNLTFVLLVGAVDTIPYIVGTQLDNPPTDLYYSVLNTGSYLPSLLLGRLPAITTAHLSNMVAKIAAYESDGGAWRKNAAFLASQDDYVISEGSHNFVIANYLDPNHYTSAKLYCHTYNATPAQVTAAVNAGQNYTVFSGHGDVTDWADGPAYYQSDVEALTNTEYPFVASFACLTGDYAQDECFSETWLRVAHGASGMLASSVYSYWTEDDWYERGMFGAAFAAVAANPSTQVMPDQVWAASMALAGKMFVWTKSNHTGNAHRYFEQYNLFGDPSMVLWTR
jgi:hypothetical protein